MGNYTFSATGGSGAAYQGKIKIEKSGNYKITVGSGGVSRAFGRAGSPYGDDGTPSSLTSPSGEILIKASGGTCGRSGPIWYSVGSGGVLIKSENLNELEVVAEGNGKNGTGYAGGGAPKVYGVTTILNNHTWGKSGDVQGNYGGGWVEPSYHGYAQVKYIAPKDEEEKFKKIYDYISNVNVFVKI